MLFKLEQEKQFIEFWAIYPRRIGKGAARRKFDKALERDSLKNIMEGLAVFAVLQKAIEKRFIPHAATWLHQDRWLDEIEAEQAIENPHPELDRYCEIINRNLEKSQRSKGNWSDIKEITEGKQTINNWLHKTTLGGWDKCLMIYKILGAMQSGTVVTSFKHWEPKLR